MHEIRRLWVRPVKGGPMVEQPSLAVATGAGIVGDHEFGADRHVTILFEDDFAAAVRDLGKPVDPSARRANVLVSGGGAREWLGRRVRLGDAVLDIAGLVLPCRTMDRAEAGLMRALAPDGRAGIWGRVLSGATIRRGDRLLPHPAAPEAGPAR